MSENSIDWRESGEIITYLNVLNFNAANRYPNE
jgi:hypothetical protein